MINPERVSIPYTEWERLRLMENRCDHLEYVLRGLVKHAQPLARSDYEPGDAMDEFLTYLNRAIAALSTEGEE